MLLLLLLLLLSSLSLVNDVVRYTEAEVSNETIPVGDLMCLRHRFAQLNIVVAIVQTHQMDLQHIFYGQDW